MTDREYLRRAEILRSLSPWGGVCVAFLGAAVLIGWWTDIPSLKTVLPGFQSMKPVTAVAFILSGGAVFLLRHRTRPARWVARASAALVGLAGILTLAAYATVFDFGADRWLFERLSAAPDAAAPAGRMSPFTALGFLLLAGFLLTRDARVSWARRISILPGTLGLLTAALALVGYAYDAQSLYQFLGTPVALHVAASFFILFASAAFAVPDRGWVAMLIGGSIGKALMRRLLLAAVAIPLILGFLATRFGQHISIDPKFGIVILALSTVFVLVIAVWRSATFLDRLDANRRDKEVSLRASQAMLSTAEHIAKVGSWDWNIVTGELIWSDEQCRMFGYTPETFGELYEAWMVCVHPDDRKRVQEAIDAAVAGRAPYDVEYPIVAQDGTERIIHAKGEVFFDEGGKALRMVGTCHDITDRVTAAAVLREHEARLRAIMENVPDGIIVIDEHGIVNAFNHAAEMLFGYTAESVCGQNVNILMPEPYRGQHDGYIGRYLQTGKGRIIGFGPREVPGRRKDGSTFPLDLAVGVTESGGKRMFIGVVRDIAQRKETEKALQHAQKMEVVGQLTGGVAHDFNNLLMAIIGNLDLAKDHVGDNPKAGSLMDVALKAALRGADLTQRLLAFSRKQALKPEVTDVNKLISGMTELMRRTLGEHIDIETVLAGGVWHILADAGQIENALLNVAINARDAMPQGGKLTIETANTHLDEVYCSTQEDVTPGQYVMVAVTDTGTGMPPEVVERAFEPFFTTKGVGKGSGLGLSMVYGFIKQSGGHIKIYSEPGRGTTIKFYLPKVTGAGQNARVTEAPRRTQPMGQETILVVEDDPDVRAFVVAALEILGYRVIEAGDGPAALALLEKLPHIDLLLTDMVLPQGMNGRQIADEVKKRHPRTKVLYTSGYTENAIIHQGALDEGIELLTKPYTRETLALKIRSVLDTPE